MKKCFIALLWNVVVDKCLGVMNLCASTVCMSESFWSVGWSCGANLSTSDFSATTWKWPSTLCVPLAAIPKSCWAVLSWSRKKSTLAPILFGFRAISVLRVGKVWCCSASMALQLPFRKTKRTPRRSNSVDDEREEHKREKKKSQHFSRLQSKAVCWKTTQSCQSPWQCNTTHCTQVHKRHKTTTSLINLEFNWNLSRFQTCVRVRFIRLFPQSKTSLLTSLLKVAPGRASLPSFVSVCNRRLPREGRMKRYSPTSRCEGR